MGAGACGAPTRRGQSFRLMNLDTIFYGIEGGTYASFPLCWVRGRGGDVMACAVVCARPLDVAVDEHGVSFKEVVVGTDVASGVDVVVFSGDATEIAKDIADLFGHAAMPPAWALGFHQSRWSYRSAEDVVGVAEGARKAGVPLDVVHLDIHMMHDYRVFTWHPRRFPDPKAMHQRLAELGVRTMAIIDPGVSTAADTPVKDALDAVGDVDGAAYLRRADGAVFSGKVWPGETVFPDFQAPGVRDVWAKAHDVLTDVGVSGIWNDMNDPVFQVGVVYDPLAQGVQHSDGSHVEKRNLYANEMAQATRQGLSAARPNERQFVLSRSGFLGIQRDAALWTGDNFSSWEQLEESLHMIVHLGLSGVPLSGADIGGFGGRRGKYGIAKFKPAPELYVRWLELGAMLPFCRVHSVLYGPKQEPWSFSSSVTAMARRLLRRRYRLLGLLSTLAREASVTGTPMVRPVWWHHDIASDHAPLAATQFLLGRDVMMAPVLGPAARRRQTYFPEGRWLDVRDGSVHKAGAGGVVVDVDAPLGSPPIFLRAGACVPWLAPGKNADDTMRAPLTMEIVAPGAHADGGRVTLDDGKSLDDGTTVSVTATHDEGDGSISIDVDVAAAADSSAVQTAMILRLPPGFSTLDSGGRQLAFRPRSFAPDVDDDRVGEVSEVEVALKSARFVAR